MSICSVCRNENNCPSRNDELTCCDDHYCIQDYEHCISIHRCDSCKLKEDCRGCPTQKRLKGVANE